jgi:hypothetical protein
MAKQYRIVIRGKQRKEIDADLMARLVVMLGSQLAEDAAQAVVVVREIAAERDPGEVAAHSGEDRDSRRGPERSA